MARLRGTDPGAAGPIGLIRDFYPLGGVPAFSVSQQPKPLEVGKILLRSARGCLHGDQVFERDEEGLNPGQLPSDLALPNFLPIRARNLCVNLDS